MMSDISFPWIRWQTDGVKMVFQFDACQVALLANQIDAFLKSAYQRPLTVSIRKGNFATIRWGIFLPRNLLWLFRNLTNTWILRDLSRRFADLKISVSDSLPVKFGNKIFPKNFLLAQKMRLQISEGLVLIISIQLCFLILPIIAFIGLNI